MVNVAESRRDEILRWLEEVKDPEVPVLSVRELGVLRDVEVSDDGAAQSIGRTNPSVQGGSVLGEPDPARH